MQLGQRGSVLPILCDVTDKAQVTKAVEETVESLKTVDILVNRAQFVPERTPLEEWTEEMMRGTWETGVPGS